MYAGGAGSSAFAPLSTTTGNPLALLTYAGPIANDAVTIGFRQHIAAKQARRMLSDTCVLNVFEKKEACRV